MIFSQRKWLFTLHWVQISFPLGILQSSATNPLLTTQDDLLWGLTSFEGAERESGAATCCCAALIDQRWFQGWPQCDSGTRPAERPSQFMGRELSLATCYPICNWVTLLWVPSYRVMNLEQEEMTEIMAWDRILMGFRKPWQSHMNNDLCMYTETNPV